MVPSKVPVSMRALIARINRKLAEDDMQLRSARSERARLDVGQYYVVNTRVNAVMYRYKDCDPEDLARELGVLKPFEKVAAE